MDLIRGLMKLDGRLVGLVSLEELVLAATANDATADQALRGMFRGVMSIESMTPLTHLMVGPGQLKMSACQLATVCEFLGFRSVDRHQILSLSKQLDYREVGFIFPSGDAYEIIFRGKASAVTEEGGQKTLMPEKWFMIVRDLSSSGVPVVEKCTEPKDKKSKKDNK